MELIALGLVLSSLLFAIGIIMFSFAIGELILLIKDIRKCIKKKRYNNKD